MFSDTRIGALSWNPTTAPAYVGKAKDGLRRRLEREHGGDTGRSTLRRSLGALLKDELNLVARPRPSKGPPKAVNFTNFCFQPVGEHRLTDWMAKHLTVIATPTENLEAREMKLIHELQPPLNLTGWDNPYANLIMEKRKDCADEARRFTR